MQLNPEEILCFLIITFVKHKANKHWADPRVHPSIEHIVAHPCFSQIWTDMKSPLSVFHEGVSWYLKDPLEALVISLWAPWRQSGDMAGGLFYWERKKWGGAVLSGTSLFTFHVCDGESVITGPQVLKQGLPLFLSWTHALHHSAVSGPCRWISIVGQTEEREKGKSGGKWDRVSLVQTGVY